MIGTRELLPSLETLAQFRRNQGLIVKVVDVEDLYDEYSFGQSHARWRYATTWSRRSRVDAATALCVAGGRCQL